MAQIHTLEEQHDAINFARRQFCDIPLLNAHNPEMDSKLLDAQVTIKKYGHLEIDKANLIEALEGMIEFFRGINENLLTEKDHEIHRKAFKAIAKAKGL